MTRCRYENGVPLMQGMTFFWALRQWDWTREPSEVPIDRVQWLFDAGFILEHHARELIRGRPLAEVLTLRTTVPKPGVTLH